MQFYFKLQQRRYTRWIRELGIHPMIGLTLAVILFLGLSFLLFARTELAKWILPELAIFLLFRIGTRKDLQVTRFIFNKTDFLKIRLVENLICIIPFVSFLLFKSEWFISLGLLILGSLMSLLNVQLNLSRTIPTPFKKAPWEFIVGFRKTFWLLPIFYFVLFRAIQVDNFNLALAIFFAHFLLAMSFYVEPEKTYFVWIFKDDPHSFLKRKWITCMFCAFLFGLPAFIVVCIFFSHQIAIILGAYFLGLLILSSVIVAKYSAYPSQMNVPQGILYAVSLFFPLILPICMWLFYRQSIRSLKPYLE